MSTQTATDNVVRKVVEEAKQEILSSLEEGLNQALKSLDDAQFEVSVETASILESANKQAETEKRKILGAADVGARNKSLQLVETTINRVFETALSDFEKKTKGKEYQNSLKIFLEESIDALRSNSITVSANSRDLKHLKGIVAKVSKERKIRINLESKTIRCVGGLRASSTNGSIIFDNTVEARLARWKSLLRKQIADMISGV